MPSDHPVDTWVPVYGYVALEETPDAVKVHLDVDAAPEDIMLDVDENRLQVAAEVHEDIQLAEGTLHSENMIYRDIPLPRNVDVSRLRASAEHGHLDIMIPKLSTAATAQRHDKTARPLPRTSSRTWP
jgi:HSP20 family molecular chaperone IbpA